MKENKANYLSEIPDKILEWQLPRRRLFSLSILALAGASGCASQSAPLERLISIEEKAGSKRFYPEAPSIGPAATLYGVSDQWLDWPQIDTNPKTYEKWDEYFKNIKEAGFDYIRSFGAWWSWWEKEKQGIWNEGHISMAHAARELMKKHDLKLLVVATSAPPWVLGGGGLNLPVDDWDKYCDLYTKYVEKVIKELDPDGIELPGEWNGPMGAKLVTADGMEVPYNMEVAARMHLSLYSKVRQLLKEKRPLIQVVAGSSGFNNADWNREVSSQASRQPNALETHSIQPYRVAEDSNKKPWWHNPEGGKVVMGSYRQRFDEEMRETKKLFRSRLGYTPYLHVGEMGYSNGVDPEGNPLLTEAQQASYYVRAVIFASAGGVDSFSLFRGWDGLENYHLGKLAGITTAWPELKPKLSLKYLGLLLPRLDKVLKINQSGSIWEAECTGSKGDFILRWNADTDMLTLYTNDRPDGLVPVIIDGTFPPGESKAVYISGKEVVVKNENGILFLPKDDINLMDNLTTN